VRGVVPPAVVAANMNSGTTFIDLVGPSTRCCINVAKISVPPKIAGPSPCNSRKRSDTNAIRRTSFTASPPPELSI